MFVEINEHDSIIWQDCHVGIQQVCDVILSNITKRKEGGKNSRREENGSKGRGGDTCEACGAVSEADIKALNVLSG